MSDLRSGPFFHSVERNAKNFNSYTKRLTTKLKSCKFAPDKCRTYCASSLYKPLVVSLLSCNSFATLPVKFHSWTNCIYEVFHLYFTLAMTQIQSHHVYRTFQHRLSITSFGQGMDNFFKD